MRILSMREQEMIAGGRGLGPMPPPPGNGWVCVGGGDTFCYNLNTAANTASVRTGAFDSSGDFYSGIITAGPDGFSGTARVSNDHWSAGYTNYGGGNSSFNGSYDFGNGWDVSGSYSNSGGDALWEFVLDIHLGVNPDIAPMVH